MGNQTNVAYGGPLTDSISDMAAEPVTGKEAGFQEARKAGLCSTCSNGSSCTLSGASETPVMFCEEFDDSLPAQTTDTPETDAAFGGGALDGERAADEEKAYVGLCVNCEQRDICRFTKPEGGVWYCEEYE